MELFGVGLPEVGLIFVVALIVLGPERFPQFARQAGRWYRVARAYIDTVMEDVQAAVGDLEEEVGMERGTVSLNGSAGDVRSAVVGMLDRATGLDTAASPTAAPATYPEGTAAQPPAAIEHIARWTEPDGQTRKDA